MKRDVLLQGLTKPDQFLKLFAEIILVVLRPISPEEESLDPLSLSQSGAVTAVLRFVVPLKVYPPL